MLDTNTNCQKYDHLASTMEFQAHLTWICFLCARYTLISNNISWKRTISEHKVRTDQELDKATCKKCKVSYMQAIEI